MNEEDRDVMELFATVRDAPVSSSLQRRLENRLTEFRSRPPGVEHILPAVRANDARCKNRILAKVGPLIGGLAAAAVLIAVVFSANSAAPAWAEVAAKVQSMDWVHFDGVASDGTKLEYWVSLKERKLAAKWNGLVFFDDASSRTRYEFNPQTNVIERRQLGDTASLYEGFSELFRAIEHGKNLAEQQPQEGARRVVIEQKMREVTVEGIQYLEYEFTFDDPEGAIGRSRSVYRVDPDTTLPVQLQKWTDLQDENHYTYAISYPATGPADIYALGVPKDASVQGR